MLKKFALGGMVVVAALLGNACGDDGSGDSPAGPADSEATLSSSSSEDVISGNSSSSSVTESPSTSSGQAPQSAESDGYSSSEKAVDGSSSSDGKTSSSSGKVESSSSGKGEKSSSSEGVAGSSSSDVVAGSSSSEKSSSSVTESSSSVESSSSEVPSSSSVVESSSSVAESSSSLETESSSSITLSSSSETPTVKSIYDAENNTLTDLRDNKVYKTVTIGDQIWMAENLNYMPEDTVGTIYSGGTVCGGGEENATEDSKMCSVSGRLYLKKIAIRSTSYQGICPDGWTTPRKTDWEKLVSFLGENAAEKLRKNDANWSSGATNESGFSSLKTCVFSNILNKYLNCNAAYYFYWSTNSLPQLFRINDKPSDAIVYGQATTEFMFPVRCIKN